MSRYLHNQEVKIITPNGVTIHCALPEIDEQMFRGVSFRLNKVNYKESSERGRKIGAEVRKKIK